MLFRSLSFTTWLLNKIVDAIDKPKNEPLAAPAPTPKATAPVPVVSKGLDKNVVAAITAAVVAATGSSAANLKFTAIKRISGRTFPWTASGNAEIMANRQRIAEGGNR